MLSSLRRNVWNWLPAFAEIAESGTVVAAARRLRLTPAALSRTLGLLEGALGTQVFDRVGRRLVLNSAGLALQDAITVATRSVETGLSDSLGDPFLGTLRVSSIGVLTDHVVVPALIDLKLRHPALLPEHAVHGPAEAMTLLARGLLDVAFYYEELTIEPGVVERLGELSAAVYCGVSHPLFRRRRVTVADVVAHPFSVPRVGDSGRVQDGWPVELPRTIGMRITMLRSNLQGAVAGAMLTVLPDVTAAEDLAAGRLRRLTVIELPPIPVFAARHRDSVGRRPGQVIIELARARLRGGRRRSRTSSSFR